jgi:hypothetical protein
VATGKLLDQNVVTCACAAEQCGCATTNTVQSTSASENGDESPKKQLVEPTVEMISILSSSLVFSEGKSKSDVPSSNKWLLGKKPEAPVQTLK